MNEERPFRVVAENLRFPEGPLALSDGAVLLGEMASGALARIDPASGHVERIGVCGGALNGLALGPDGAIYVCNNGGTLWREQDGALVPGLPSADYAGGSIQRVRTDGTGLETLYRTCGEHALSAPNDLVFDSTGGFWFTDTGKHRARSRDHGGVYYARPDGSSIEEVVHPLTTPNGIRLSPGERELYVAETVTGRLWAWPVVAPGKLGRVGRGPRGARLVYGFAGHQLLDSLAVDSEGNVCVATLVTGAISVVSPDGRLLDQLRVPGDDPFVTNICFGGRDRRTAYVTSSGRGRLFALDWRCSGLPLAF